MEVRLLKKSSVIFKGSRDGIHLEIAGDDFKQIVKEIGNKIKASPQFFKGAKFNGIKSDELSKEETLEIKLILKYKYEFDVNIELVATNQDTTFISEEYKFENLDEGMTKFIYGTLRSGQVVDFYGNIVVVGDVNPGALLKAGGNIVALGSLKGVAQAGGDNDLNAIVAAYSLLPTQLRIGTKIARPPEGDTQYKLPEIARVFEGELIIEPYLPSK